MRDTYGGGTRLVTGWAACARRLFAVRTANEMPCVAGGRTNERKKCGMCVRVVGGRLCAALRRRLPPSLAKQESHEAGREINYPTRKSYLARFFHRCSCSSGQKECSFRVFFVLHTVLFPACLQSVGCCARSAMMNPPFVALVLSAGRVFNGGVGTRGDPPRAEATREQSALRSAARAEREAERRVSRETIRGGHRLLAEIWGASFRLFRGGKDAGAPPPPPCLA